MSEVKVPDIGDFTDVPVIEVHVSAGDAISKDDPLITLESDKATMDVPAPQAGTVEEVLVSVGDELSEGDPILSLEPEDGDEGEEEEANGEEAEAGEREQPGGADDREPAPAPAAGERRDEGVDVVVIGSGPGGYTAAFRAADLGLETVLVERYESLGGVCLNVGCIPSKALLHAAKVIDEAATAADFGVELGEPKIDRERLGEWRSEVVGKLTGGLAAIAKRRQVRVVTGTARFSSADAIEVDGEQIAFKHCIIAAGSRSAMLPGLPDDPRIVDSTGALELGERAPKRMLVIGGGIIGLEMATVYEGLGSRVSVVELTDELIPGCDRDLVKPLQKRIEPRYEAIMLGTKVAGVEAQKKGLKVSFEGEDAPGPEHYDRVLVAVGRRANGDRLDLDAAGVEVGEDGIIPVDERRRTSVPHIFAIGDITGHPMLAHKATHEGKIAAEVIAGEDVIFDPRAIPSVAYTDPEVAWTGLTELEAKAEGIEYERAAFPWQASGRALSLERPEGLTKLLVDPDSRRVLGAGMVGPNAGELVAEATLAIEMGASAEDLGLTIHPHPTLSETVAFAAEVAEGVATDIYAPKR